MRTALACVIVGWFATAAFAQTESKPTRPLLRVVYFIPSDRQPEPRHQERLDRVLTEVQRFFREGMQQRGFGPLTFDYERDTSGLVKLHEVRGKLPMTSYGRNDAGKVREEVKAELAPLFNVDGETILIFQVLLHWQGQQAIEVGPYVGGGDAFGGTAWVYDDAKLDPQLLASTEAGGYYHAPCSLGQFNTHYIGGVAHELGHALGLPHERERLAETPRLGSSLMGSGNHTYGQELRGEGRGTFLTAAAALPLSSHPLFTGKRQPRETLDCDLAELTAKTGEKQFTLTGKLTGERPLAGLVAYVDPLAVAGDYDALTATSKIDDDGHFQLAITDLQPGSYELRLRPLGKGGGSLYFPFSFDVDPAGTPQLESLLEGTWLRRAVAAYSTRNLQQLENVLTEAKRSLPQAKTLHGKLAHYQFLSTARPPQDLLKIPTKTKTVPLSDVAFESEKTGWGPSLRNQVLADGDASGLLEVGGKFFKSGLYAHAPARHVVRLNQGWTTLTTQFGLQDRHDGSVVFVILGDGKELFRSPTIHDHQVREQSIQVAGITRLELLVEDGGNGNNSDWGVWLNPRLER